jgi:uroporphyrinogen decarboxylase
MTPKQRWLAWWEGGRPDRIPCDYWGTAEITSRLLRDLGCASEPEMWVKLGIDKCIMLAPKNPRATETTWHIPSLFSVWGVETRSVPYMDGLGSYDEAINPPLAKAESARDVERHPWPAASDWDYSQLRAECEQWRDYPIVGASYEPFYLYSRLRGMEQAIEDLVSNEAIVDAAMERIYEIHSGIVRGALEAAGDRIDFISVAEDLGTQESLLMSPRLFRRFIKPWLGRMCDLSHQFGAKVYHHDDGAIRPLIPELLEIGVDLLNPVQWRCKGMDREGLARDFGDRVVFHGAVDNQHTLPFGTPEDVRQQVRENIEIFGGGKGYVVAPCHNLQANTPTENVVAMYAAVEEFGGRYA